MLNFRISILCLSLLVAVICQNNTCYANCLVGSCLALSPLVCSACDLGLLNLNGNCIGSSLQSPPITYLKPSLGGLADENTSILNCQISDFTGLTKMYFYSIVGSTFTRLVNLAYDHSYVQIKLNAIVYGVNVQALSFSNLILNVYSQNINIYSESLQLQVQKSVNCNNNTRQALGVFTLNKKISSSDSSILIQIRQSSNSNQIAISNLEIYFGKCSKTCATCIGPTDNQCLTCRGLFNRVFNLVCINCPDGFYASDICRSCPETCLKCNLVNNIVNCTSCIDATMNINNNCKTQNATIIVSSSLGWTSTETKQDISTICGYYSLIGGISIGKGGSVISKLFTKLVAHSSVYIKFTLFLIDQISGDVNSMAVSVDNQVLTNSVTIPLVSNTYNLTNECGSNDFEYILKLNFSFPHTSDSLKFSIKVLKDYWGFSDLIFLFNNETNVTDCDKEVSGQCITCRNGLALINNTCISCPDNFYLNATTNQCNICPFDCQNCQYRSNLNIIKCTSCFAPLILTESGCKSSNQNIFAIQIIPQIQKSINQNQWIIYPKLQQQGIDKCGSQIILGSSQIKYKSVVFRRTFTGLPAHTGVTLTFHYYQIDDYPSNDIYFVLNNQIIPYNRSNIRLQLCGNSTPDSIQKINLRDAKHIESSITFQIHVNAMAKMGINNVVLTLLNSAESFNTEYSMDIIPIYSINTPPLKGLKVKLTFPSSFKSNTDITKTFNFNISTQKTRLLQISNLNPIITNPYLQIVEVSTNANREIVYIINGNRDLLEQSLISSVSNPTGIYFENNGLIKLVDKRTVSEDIPTYIEVNVDSLDNRSNIRNIANLFKGCAILALWVGLFSFIVGMSAAFDDFFILCQIIFVHVFIQFAYNPPSVRLTFEALSIVQFMSWLPWPAREGIEKGIIANNLYQHSPMAFEQYYQDIVFARTIYQAVLFLLAMVVLWLILYIAKSSLGLDNQETRRQKKYTHYLYEYYLNYENRKFVFIDKVIRFTYFTIVWACLLQLTNFQNQPKEFHIWNSIICILFLIFVVLYPIIAFYHLYSRKDQMHVNTFAKKYEELRIDSSRLGYFIFRYYKLLAIGLCLAFATTASGAIPGVILIVLNLLDVGWLLIRKPLGMFHQQTVDLQLFYSRYQKVYFITTIIQQILLIILEIIFLILVGQRLTSNTNAIGYVICAIVILLLLNGLVRLFWGFMKIGEHCYISHQANMQSIDKQIQENKQLGEEAQPIADQLNKNPTILNRKQTMILQQLNSRKMSIVSKVGH